MAIRMRSLRPLAKAIVSTLVLAAPAFLDAHSAGTGATLGTGGRRVLHDSIKEVSGQAAIVRTALTEPELAEQITVSVSLRMRGLDELNARIARGQNLANGGLTQADLESSYLPSPDDYASVRSWLASQGLELVQSDSNHTTVFARGSVASISEVFGVSFARVAVVDGEFTSAVNAPSLPSSLPDSILGVDGLQPHLHARPQTIAASSGTQCPSPTEVLRAYAAPSNLTGSGQTIAIVMAANPSTADLTQFWTAAGIPQSLANFTSIQVGNGPTAASQSADLSEVTLDVEWTSGMAPGAKVRLYECQDTSLPSLNQALLQIISDSKTNPSLSVVSISTGGNENLQPLSAIQTMSQSFVQLAAAGVTVVSSSGDGGSNQNGSTGTYQTTNALTVLYPASDPNVTGVGGTNLTFTNSWGYSSESVWSNIPNTGAVVGQIYLASGGGVSSIFAQPSWQNDGGSVLAANSAHRCVPDIAIIAGCPVIPPVIVLNGTVQGEDGTSLSAPVFAGVVALVNQARAANGKGPIGVLGPVLYPLHGSDAFTDITSGTNGAYSAGPGYDLCTGLGSPNITNLINALGGGSTGGTPPSGTITAAAPSAPLTAGSSMSLSVSAVGSGPFTYQWTLNNVPIAGATSSAYSVVVGTRDAGTYSVTITGSAGFTSVSAGTLTVTTNAWLTNLSARAYVEGSPNILIAGFVTTGTSPKQILVRGAGPALAGFNLTGFLTNPWLQLFNGPGTAIASNTAWASNLTSTFAELGAFSFQTGSNDTAMDISVPPGAYTAQISSTTAQNGVAIAEIYDADGGAPANRLINISARAFVGSGANILIGGFVISGTTSETVLIRGVGPALKTFGLSTALSNPVLTIFDSTGKQIAQNTGWQNPVTSNGAAVESATSETFTDAGAFVYPDGSADSALVITLPPGGYTAQVSGVPTSTAPTGVGLVEIYEMK